MDKRKLKKMGILDLSFLDEVAALKLEHPDWDMKTIGRELKESKKISVSSKELSRIMDQCGSLFADCKGDLPSLKKSREEKPTRVKRPLCHWGWFAW